MSGIADRIVADIRARNAFEPREDEIGGMDDAYRIQRAVTEALLGASPGRSVAGYKIAFNRQSSMDYYGLSEPCYAPLFSDQIHGDGAVLPLSGFRDLVIEPEIAVELAAPVTGDESDEALAGAVARFIPAIEIMDARGAFPRDPTAAAAVAQRVHSAGAVLGGTAASAEPDCAAVTARLKIDGVLAEEATGAAPQTPLEALRWLAARLAKDGLPLDAGMIVLTGAHLPGKALGAPCVVEVAMEPLGTVRLRVS